MSLFNRFRELINKDTPTENEPKKMAVLIRIMCITLIIFFALNFFGFLIFGKTSASLGNLVLGIIYLLVFGLSYKVRKMTVVWLFILATTAWAVSMLWLFGPDSCFQIFPPFLIIIFFFASYDSFARKVIFGLITFAIYLGMLILYGSRDPMLEIDLIAHRYMRDSCMFAIILCTCIAAHVFSKESQTMENKLIIYNRKLKEKAGTDPLTGLNNRGHAMEYLQEFAKKADEVICSICICDIDHFKVVNDTYGHDVGDKVLREVAKVLTDTTGSAGFVARWGGEEFFLAFPDLNGDDAYELIYKIQNNMRYAVVNVEDTEISVTLTYGLTEYDKSKSLNDNIKDADNKLYMGKEQGRNRIIY